MTRQKFLALSAIILFGGFVAAALFIASRDDEMISSVPVSKKQREQVVVGGVRRPLSDVQSAFADPENTGEGPMVDDPKLTVGTAPMSPPSTNPTVAMVYEAVTSGKNPEQVSPMFQPEPFDREAYLANPEQYLIRHEPGRIWQSAQPGPGVPVIARLSPAQSVMDIGEAIALRIQTQPGMPATFVSFDLGTFDNRLSTITVAADDDGVATANFNASSGKIGDINVMAASPVATERVRFSIYIRPKAK